MKIKNKNYLLLFGFILMILIGYFAAFKDTLAVYSNYKMLIEQEKLAANFPQKKYALETKSNYYDSLLHHYRITDTSLQNNLLNVLEDFAKKEKLQILSFEKPHISSINDYTVQSYQFSVTGEYHAILKLAYHLEQRHKFGMIASLNLEKVRIKYSKENHLVGNILLQLIK
ncbi:type 4a pilus biogenesis protein PilO [Dokdonia sp. Hel_I_53]|uniref:type 4a pilus biogenesis protein PilO n=1 Tax=Dokdonia sp. Hel_I_53 TaxID=1566287 RepID=UPI00119C6811|nr:hypothetical protein [Dokdonia sp. Hel_I_53]TVZ52268.1 hypothetical protein OD90_1438 [Dokdonia sp. Hel_I_53]